MKISGTCLATLAGLVSVCAASAQQPSPPTLDAVELQGIERASEQLVRSQIEAAPGQPYNPRAVARDIRRLYELGFFTTIKADLSTVGGRTVLTYIFEEQRFVDDVLIVGNDKLRTRQIRGALVWKPGDAYVEQAYPEARDAVLDLYAEKGFVNATVDIVVEEIGPSRVRVVYVLDEGKKAKIKGIDIEGNEVLSDRRLKKVVRTRRALWFLGGKYDEDKFNADLVNIVDEYGNHGRLEAAVPKSDFDYSPNGKKLFITIYVSEGPEYHVESLDIAENFVFDDDEILNIVEIQAGDIHNKGQVEDDAILIEDGYRESGYVNAQAVPLVTLDRENKTTRIVHRINEGDLKYIREVKITGNDVTRDDVIRRRVLLVPGERFDGAALRMTEDRLEATDYFDETRTTLEDDPDDPRFTNLVVDVTEGRTGNFNFGGGFSTDEGFGGFAQLELRNFDITNWPSLSGGGQILNTRFSIGDVRNQFSVSFTDPEILGYPLAFGVDVFNESFRTTGGSDFQQDTRGGRLRIGKALSNFVTARAALRYSDTKISDFGLEIFLAPVVRELRNPDSTISAVLGIARDTRDHFRDPTSGATHDLALEIAGLGGDNEFVKLQHDSTWFWAIDAQKKWILSLRTREGIAETYGSTDLVPLEDRLFAGGTTTVRGYDTRDIGPQIREFGFFGDRQRIGGELRLVQNFEVKYKINDLFRLYTFADAGGVWFDTSDFDFGDMRYSVGVGLGIDIRRLGPIRIDYGFPINPDDDQGSGRLHLTTGFRF